MDMGDHNLLENPSTALGYLVAYLIVCAYIFYKDMWVFGHRIFCAWVGGFSPESVYARAATNQTDDNPHLICRLIATWSALLYNGSILLAMTFGWPLHFLPLWLVAWAAPTLVLYAFGTALFLLGMSRLIPWLSGWNVTTTKIIT